ncbi:hypothetical protein C1I63_01490 [Rathayibacter caricis DSM 15933]|uniref:YdhG-like domain-containing protein n=1 Tax=Rathayibacter caricis DSM 15933 TaxID=1328867 RepID=A0A2T4UYE6_9MICO|nr:DUF1801 domain-containing protein [Rathayibacter caricis]PTL74553.1 hypothetical protein C1I63_01490 [Rathayibacter caricis DSM 15933]
MSASVATVEEYLAAFPPERRARLEEVRRLLLQAVPDAEERIRYGMPAVMLGGRYAIHWAGWKTHVGLHPVPRLSPELEHELAALRTGKDTVALPWNRELPAELVSRVAEAIVELRAPEGTAPH